MQNTPWDCEIAMESVGIWLILRIFLNSAPKSTLIRENRYFCGIFWSKRDKILVY